MDDLAKDDKLQRSPSTDKAKLAAVSRAERVDFALESLLRSPHVNRFVSRGMTRLGAQPHCLATDPEVELGRRDGFERDRNVAKFPGATHDLTLVWRMTPHPTVPGLGRALPFD